MSHRHIAFPREGILPLLNFIFAFPRVEVSHILDFIYIGIENVSLSA
jgi:hypothetical protein